ncbi:MAG: hypothetical protein COU25_03565 [Candidatus Levybacteria bacterium CG10_big_fil_rev_8_21_14_0_10_35_13]|nr:MAG: hypothetical protein COU25_03565 [Candidatus Levybacteria bacterium CG10_big_fil_rev_8_21_14_0_10_35_13]
MNTILDTSSLLRFFTNDEPLKAIKVKELLENGKNLYIPDVVFPELEYVLTDHYNSSRENIIKIFQFLSSQKNIKVSANIKKALPIFEKTKFDIADCIIAASSFKGSLASFDKELLQVKGINSIWK